MIFIRVFFNRFFISRPIKTYVNLANTFGGYRPLRYLRNGSSWQLPYTPKPSTRNTHTRSMARSHTPASVSTLAKLPKQRCVLQWNVCCTQRCKNQCSRVSILIVTSSLKDLGDGFVDAIFKWQFCFQNNVCSNLLPTVKRSLYSVLKQTGYVLHNRSKSH